MDEPRPLLIYDGDCGICRDWVAYWRRLTGARVDYRPYQEAAVDDPRISLDACRKSIQLIEPDGQVHAGAAAAFGVLRRAPGHGHWWWLYRHVPGFAPAAERAYGWCAQHRGGLRRLTYALWGPTLEPARFRLVSQVFLRLLGLIYVAAFGSLALQVEGLVGSRGILPLTAFLNAVQAHFGTDAYLAAPTLFWLDASDTWLAAGTWAGVALGLCVVFGRMQRTALVALYVLYLSYVYAGQAFMTYQWDLLLLEAGFLAIFLGDGSRIVVWLYRWLVFRFLFMAGAAKLASGDATWRALTALDYHFWTQPLPSPAAWYAAQLPHALLALGTGAALALELVLVFLAFAPRRLRAFAAWATLLFQASIMLTGSYGFFNLLTMLLCVFLFDDAALGRVLPGRLAARLDARAPQPGRGAAWAASGVALIVVPAGLNQMWQMVYRSDLPVAATIERAVMPLLIVNPYGLFANMTTSRPEIVIEGSADGKTWQAYAFRYKPGDVSRAPAWNIPHQPRLDWQMWFAAQDPVPPRWFANFLLRLLQNSPPVTALLASDPFAGHPPRLVRARLYEYAFADAATRARTGHWWGRELAGDYFPAVGLEDFEGGRIGAMALPGKLP